MPNPSNLAMEEQWKKEEADKSALEKAYQSGKKKGDATTLDPNKLDSELLDQLPSPTGWRIMILPYKGQGQTEGGIVLTSETRERQQIGTLLGYVLKVGPQAYDGERFSTGPWCKPGDWVLIGRYSGSRIQIEGGEIKLLNDDEIIATVLDPEAILHQF